MNPNRWLEEKKTTAVAIAGRLAVHESVLSRCLSGARYPSFPLMWAFHKISKGAVSLPDWIKLFEAKARAGDALPSSRASTPQIEARRKRKG